MKKKTITQIGNIRTFNLFSIVFILYVVALLLYLLLFFFAVCKIEIHVVRLPNGQYFFKHTAGDVYGYVSTDAIYAAQ